MKKSRWIVLAVSVLAFAGMLTISGCSSGGVKNVDADGVRKAQDKGAVVVDIREPVEYQNGHIPGSVNIPMGTVETEMAEWARDTQIVVYCNTANRSSDVVPRLVDMGFTDILHYNTGLVTWDGDLEKGDGSTTTGSASATATDVLLSGPAMYEFYTDWCPGCKEMKPIVESLEADYKGKVEFKLYNVDESSEGSALAQKLGMSYVPSFVLVDSSGKIVESWAGAVTKQELKTKLDAIK